MCFLFLTLKYVYDRLFVYSMVASENVSTVTYECMRCGTPVTVEELSRLPEIKCICGFRVFRKSRAPVVKQLKAI
jgi:DNA-directed RNA polymerase subunit P